MYDFTVSILWKCFSARVLLPNTEFNDHGYHPSYPGLLPSGHFFCCGANRKWEIDYHDHNNNIWLKPDTHNCTSNSNWFYCTWNCHKLDWQHISINQHDAAQCNFHNHSSHNWEQKSSPDFSVNNHHDSSHRQYISDIHNTWHSHSNVYCNDNTCDADNRRLHKYTWYYSNYNCKFISHCQHNLSFTRRNHTR